MMTEGSFELRPIGPYSFGASVRFLEGFAPAAYEGKEAGHLHLAFVADGGDEVAGVCVREEDGVILGEVYGEAGVEVVRRQVERILSLESEELQRLAQNWRPYRTWVTLHLRAMLEDQTGEIASQTKT
jgi:hypothetical protein